MSEAGTHPATKDVTEPCNPISDHNQARAGTSGIQVFSTTSYDLPKPCRLSNISFANRQEEVITFISKRQVLRTKVEELLRYENALINWPDREGGHISLWYHQFRFRPIVNWQNNVMSLLIRTFRRFKIENISVNPDIWHRHVKPYADKMFDKIDVVYKSSTNKILLCGYRDEVESWSSAILCICDGVPVDLTRNSDVRDSKHHLKTELEDTRRMIVSQDLRSQEKKHMICHGLEEDKESSAQLSKSSSQARFQQLSTTSTNEATGKGKLYMIKSPETNPEKTDQQSSSSYRTEPVMITTATNGITRGLSWLVLTCVDNSHKVPRKELPTTAATRKNIVNKADKRFVFPAGLYLMSYFILFSVCSVPVAALTQHPVPYSLFSSGPACAPTISDSTPENHVFRQIECEISTCKNVTKIIYEKTDQLKKSKWISVFEGISKTVFHTLDTGDNGYSLEHRNDYTAFHTKHLLYIKPLQLEEQGQWRCIVYDNNNTSYVSEPVAVNIFVTPKEHSFNIAPINPLLVTYQAADFICVVDGIHPEPDVIWNVNGVQHLDGIPSNKQRADGLWFVMNTIRLQFDRFGLNILDCVIKTRTRDPWLKKNIDIDVKETANVLEPTDELTIPVGSSSVFTLNCTGSGYKPSITWHTNGKFVRNSDIRYTIQQVCNETTCISSLTSLPTKQPLTCHSANRTEVYTCIISLGLPYVSNHTSAKITVNILHPPQITSPHNNTSSGAHCNVTLTCNVCRGTSFVWKYNGTNLIGTDVTELPDGSVVLHNNQKFGKFVRTVGNSVGKIYCIVILHDSEQPCSTARNGTITVIVACSVILTLIVFVATTLVMCKRKPGPPHQNAWPNDQLDVGLVNEMDQTIHAGEKTI